MVTHPRDFVEALGEVDRLRAIVKKMRLQLKNERVEVEAAQRVIIRLERECAGHKPEVAPLLWTMRHRAEAHGVSLVAMVRAYSSPLRGFGGDRGAWVRALPMLPTRGYRVPWWTSLDGVRSFLAGTLPDPCRRPALHFGSVADMRARFPNAVPIDCGVPPGGNVFITESGT
ncbi:MAG: hypothetical protein WC211_00695 [Dehalococcoidia bacterium]